MIENYQEVHKLFNHIAEEGNVQLEQVTLNPLGDFEDVSQPKLEDWRGLMYLYTTSLSLPTRLQIVSLSRDVMDILPVDSDFVREMKVETPEDFYASWLSRYNKHPDASVGAQLVNLASVLFHEGYEVRCQEWSKVAEQLDIDMEGITALTFPLMIFTHPESEIKFVINCEPVVLQ